VDKNICDARANRSEREAIGVGGIGRVVQDPDSSGERLAATPADREACAGPPAGADDNVVAGEEANAAHLEGVLHVDARLDAVALNKDRANTLVRVVILGSRDHDPACEPAAEDVARDHDALGVLVIPEPCAFPRWPVELNDVLARTWSLKLTVRDDAALGPRNAQVVLAAFSREVNVAEEERLRAGKHAAVATQATHEVVYLALDHGGHGEERSAHVARREAEAGLDANRPAAEHQHLAVLAGRAERSRARPRALDLQVHDPPVGPARGKELPSDLDKRPGTLPESPDDPRTRQDSPELCASLTPCLTSPEQKTPAGREVARDSREARSGDEQRASRRPGEVPRAGKATGRLAREYYLWVLDRDRHSVRAIQRGDVDAWHLVDMAGNGAGLGVPRAARE